MKYIKAKKLFFAFFCSVFFIYRMKYFITKHILITYQQPVENLVKTRDRNITTSFGSMKTLFSYRLF